MESVILGTGASEGVPCVFCDCPSCTYAREHGGHDIRTRSSFLIDSENMVDFSRDLFYQALKSGICLKELKRIFLTHFHEDHVSVEEMGCRKSAVSGLEGSVEVVCSPPVAEQIQLLFERFRDHNEASPKNYFDCYRLVTVEPFREYEAGEMTFIPIVSSHHGYGIGEMGYNYLFQTEKSRLLYAVDTGWYEEETWDFLRGRKQDYVILECTYGDMEIPKKAREHLNLSNVFLMLERLLEIGCITRETPIYLTHICHLHSQNHQHTQESLKNCGFHVTVSYDGMKISHPHL